MVARMRALSLSNNSENLPYHTFFLPNILGLFATSLFPQFINIFKFLHLKVKNR